MSVEIDHLEPLFKFSICSCSWPECRV